MRKLSFLLFLLVLAATAYPQDRTEMLDTIRQDRRIILQESRLIKSEAANREVRPDKNGKRGVTLLSVTDEEVGEASSFNKNAKFFGIVASGVVLVEPSCDPLDLGFELGPDDRCIEVTNPLITTSAVFNDIGRVTLPGKKADNIIYGIFNHTTSVFMSNPAAAAAIGTAVYSPSVTIESEALNDPAAIDPNTGLPMNGSFTTGGLGSRSNQKTLAPGTIELKTESYSRAGTLGFSRSFWAAIGLPQSVINELYKKPITFRLNMRVAVRNVESGTFLFSARFLAN